MDPLLPFICSFYFSVAIFFLYHAIQCAKERLGGMDGLVGVYVKSVCFCVMLHIVCLLFVSERSLYRFKKNKQN